LFLPSGPGTERCRPKNSNGLTRNAYAPGQGCTPRASERPLALQTLARVALVPQAGQTHLNCQ
jgi:hypothetical protein